MKANVGCFFFPQENHIGQNRPLNASVSGRNFSAVFASVPGGDGDHMQQWKNPPDLELGQEGAHDFIFFCGFQ